MTKKPVWILSAQRLLILFARLQTMPASKARSSLARSLPRTKPLDAASVAGLILTTEAAVVDAPKPEAGGGGMPDMGGMGGMGGMM